MKKLLALIITCFSLSAAAQNIGDMTSENMTLTQWKEAAKSDLRLLPKYGHQPKTEVQKGFDKDFIDITLMEDSTRRKASNHLVKLGFTYIYNDLKTAMYHFNQAWLLDSTNADVYWGFGGVYMVLGDYTDAAKQYREGLAINKNNTHLLTDYASYLFAKYYSLQSTSEKAAATNLDSAIIYLNTSYQLDPKDPNTTFKLSLCYMYKKDCDNAWKYYNESKAIGGQPISEEYTNALKEACKQGK